MRKVKMRRILISGGSRGIGAECVRRFSALGDAVAFIYNMSAEAAQKLAAETGAIAICADVSDSVSARCAVDEATIALGGIDILINNAGIAHIGLFTDITDDEWRRLCDTNLSGAIYLSREASKYMIRQHSGSIVNIGSVWGRAGASCEVAYSATKAGLRGFTRALAKELGPSGITVNCIEPGVIDTEMNACLDDETRASLADETPLGRLGTAEDVAAAIEFLTSSGASFITGQIIGVDGGFGW